MKEYELYKQGKIKLTKEEIAKYQFAQGRHNEIENFINIFKLPFVLSRFIMRKSRETLRTLRNVENLENLKKEVARLNLVIESKARAKEKMLFSSIANWDDKFLKHDGFFNIGIDENGNLVYLSFLDSANLLVGGEPGGGKTNLINLLAYQALRYQSKVSIIDFKGLDFERFRKYCNVVNDHNSFILVLEEAKNEIERRKALFKAVGAVNLKEYNFISNENMKRYYIFIDELGEAMEIIDFNLSKTDKNKLLNYIEQLIKSIARLGRAFGVNLIAGTQRPDVGILEGQARDQFTSRIAFKCVDNTSRIVLGNLKASELGNEPGRAIVKNRTDFIKTQVFLFNKDLLNTLPELPKNPKIPVQIKEDVTIIDYDNI